MSHVTKPEIAPGSDKQLTSGGRHFYAIIVF